jgi:phosphoribosyl-ATP pyrophosphohydrolase
VPTKAQRNRSLSDIIKFTIDLRAHIESVTSQKFKKEAAGWHLPICPFCGSHSGFHISAKTPHLWKCFNCSEKRDSIIAFEKRRLDCNIKEAMKALVNQYGITTTTKKRVEEKVSASLPYPPESTYATPNPNRVLAKTIWENAKPLPLENAVKILQKRGFGKYVKKLAPILAQIVRINTWKGTKKLALPQIEKGEIVGLHMICQDLHTKNDLDEKAGAFLLSAGKHKDTCIIVESLFNALALLALGYSALIMFGCENKKAIANWLPTARKKCNRIILWLDRGKEELSQRYCSEFNLDAMVVFEPEKADNYAVKDMLAESDTDFLPKIERYIAEAYAQSSQAKQKPAHKPKPKPEAMEVVELRDKADRKSIDEAFAGWDDTALIVGVVGSGKTYGAENKELAAIRENIPFCYAANNRTDLEAYHKGVTAKTAANILPLMGGRTGLDDDSDTYEQREKEIITLDAPGVAKNYLWLNTHLTFLMRKGIGNKVYSLVNWIKETRPFMVMDEINEFVSRLELLIPLEVMATTNRRKGTKEPYTSVFHKCPSFATHSYRCHKCQICRNLQYNVDTYGNAKLEIPSGKASQMQSYIPVFQTVDGAVIAMPEVNYTTTLLQQESGYLEKKIANPNPLPTRYEDNEIFGRDDLNDIINCSLKPSLVDIYPTFNNMHYQHDERYSEEIKAKVKFPSLPCGRYLALCDLLILKIIAQYARGARFLCTDISQHTTEILQHVFPNLRIVRVNRQAEKLENVILLGHSKELMPGAIAEQAHNAHEANEVKTLQFEQSNKQVSNAFKKCPTAPGYSIGMFLSGECIPKRTCTTEELYQIIANAHSVYGKSLNLTMFAQCITNGALFKPYIAYPHERSKEDILKQILQYRIELICQTLGRILREDKKKPIPYRVCMVHNIAPEDFELVTKSLRLDEIAKQQAARFIKYDEKLFWEMATKFVTTGQIIERSENQQARKMSPRQRELRADEIAAEKAARQQQKKQENTDEIWIAAIKMQKQNFKYRDVYKKLHLERYPEIVEKLKQLFVKQ